MYSLELEFSLQFT